MNDRSIRPGVLVFVGLVAAALAFVVLRSGQRPPSEAPRETVRSANEQGPPAGEPRASSLRDRERTPRAASPSLDDPVPYVEGLVWGDIDLREARELMPDNLYWKLGAPTKDEKVLAERDAEKARRNQEYGRVLAGDATEDEVRAYYDYRRRLAADYVEFSEFMQRKLRDSPNEQLRSMIDLALKMNADRLRQLAAEQEDAIARSQERAQVREDWRRQQEEFRGVGQPGDAPH